MNGLYASEVKESMSVASDILKMLNGKRYEVAKSAIEQVRNVLENYAIISTENVTLRFVEDDDA